MTQRKQEPGSEREKKFKILVVDDEPDMPPLVRQAMRPEIRAGKYSFLFAGDGSDALEQLEQNEDVDMVVSDINMPRMDGLTLLEQISTQNLDIRAIIISAYGDMKNIRKAMNRGAFDFITKPMDFEDFRITIERARENLIAWRTATESRDRLLEIQHELDLASRMQRAILPTSFPSGPEYEIHGSMTPAHDVSGDFFDVIALDQGRYGLAIADVSGKGIPAALFMMSSRTILKGAAIGLEQPSQVLTEVNNLIHQDNENTMFITLIYAGPMDGFRCPTRVRCLNTEPIPHLAPNLPHWNVASRRITPGRLRANDESATGSERKDGASVTSWTHPQILPATPAPSGANQRQPPRRCQ